MLFSLTTKCLLKILNNVSSFILQAAGVGKTRLVKALTCDYGGTFIDAHSCNLIPEVFNDSKQ